MPTRGWDCVTVPGAVRLWSDLHRKFGRLAFEELFKPAINYAENGFLLSPETARLWKNCSSDLHDQPGFREHFLSEKALEPGSMVRLPEHAKTLLDIGETHGDSFYEGKIAENLVSFAERTGGSLSKSDLKDHRSEWVDTLAVDYRGCQLHELPPNGQGISALIAVRLAEILPLDQWAVDSAESIHHQIVNAVGGKLPHSQALHGEFCH